MRLIKLDFAVVFLSSMIGLLLLMWNESSVTCDIVTCKLFETLLAIVALFSAVECTKIKLEKK